MNKNIQEQIRRIAARPANAKSLSYYLVTIKRNAFEFTSYSALNQQYQLLVKNLRNTQWSSNVSYELDTLQRLHLHTYISCEVKPYFKKHMVKGWHIHFQSFPKEDITEVIKYILKNNTQHPIEIEQLEHYSYYSLTDTLN